MSNQLLPHFEAVEANFNEMAKIHGEVNFKKESLFALQALQANNFLTQTAFENPESLKNAIMNVAATGLTLNPVTKEAYLVPMDHKVVLQVSYLGLKRLAESSGSIKYLRCELVYSLDKFSLVGEMAPPVHEFNPFSKERGELVGGYCYVKTSNNEYLTTTMRIDEIIAIRDRSQGYKAWKSGRAKSAIWETDFEEMAKKTIIKRSSKLWPKTDQRTKKAVEIENENEGIDFENEVIERKSTVPQVDYKKKAELVEQIKSLMAITTEGLSKNEKWANMKVVLGVANFNDVSKYSEEKLTELVATLENQVKRIHKVEITTDDIAWEDKK